MQQKNKKILRAVMAVVLLEGMLLLSKQAATVVPSSTENIQVSWGEAQQDVPFYARFHLGKREQDNGNAIKPGQRHVVIDAGHGGIDPGKIGVNQVKEKDINLQIALKVKKYLEAGDIRVTMVREEDKGLYEATDSNKKVTDMRKRVDLIDASGADVAVSIHQNSYHTEDVKGAQVFYYKSSPAGQDMAMTMQATLIQLLRPEKEREAKQNDSYYLLKKTSTPTIIVECGFLSNWQEAKALSEDSYQDRVAWAIAMGIRRYLNGIK